MEGALYFWIANINKLASKKEVRLVGRQGLLSARLVKCSCNSVLSGATNLRFLHHGSYTSCYYRVFFNNTVYKNCNWAMLGNIKI